MAVDRGPIQVMADPVNLNRARKAKARREAAKEAAENRIRFGLTKAEKQTARNAAAKLARGLDSHKREP
jgi:hypothetical protein